ncbi:Eukaryotic/viral aspartic protease [Phytophthora megakarya]|uniref:Eukaryotic/viral aspartic protease n=1 Tax=Phytophthora megakarya TaxID=4795 RepID=A0A225VNM6_9STRA|nr:Eukaryotic/viral aspartic protease [Phytophthora megakarya]
MSVFAYVAKRSRDAVRRCTATLKDNTCESKMVRTALERAPRVSAIRFTDYYARETPLSAIDLQPGERCGYCKHYALGKWYKQANIYEKLNNRKAVQLLDTGTEVSILDTTFAREVGFQIDAGVTQECVGIGAKTYVTVGTTRVKSRWRGTWCTTLGRRPRWPERDLRDELHGVRIDTADGTACLQDEIRIKMIGR